MQDSHLVFITTDLQDWFPSSHKLLLPKLVYPVLTEVNEADLINLKKKKGEPASLRHRSILFFGKEKAK